MLVAIRVSREHEYENSIWGGFMGMVVWQGGTHG